MEQPAAIHFQDSISVSMAVSGTRWMSREDTLREAQDLAGVRLGRVSDENEAATIQPRRALPLRQAQKLTGMEPAQQWESGSKNTGSQEQLRERARLRLAKPWFAKMPRSQFPRKQGRP